MSRRNTSAMQPFRGRYHLNLAHDIEYGHKTAYACKVASDIMIVTVMFLESLSISEPWLAFFAGQKLPWHANIYHLLQYRPVKVLDTAPLP